jgi:hypothetical protein
MIVSVTLARGALFQLVRYAFSNDEIGLKEISGVNPDQGDLIGGREPNHGIPRDDIIADRGL